MNLEMDKTIVFIFSWFIVGENNRFSWFTVGEMNGRM